VWRNWAIEHGFDPVEVVGRAMGAPGLTTIREYLPERGSFAENREVERREIDDVEGGVFLPGGSRVAGQSTGGPLDDATFMYEGAGGSAPASRWIAHSRTLDYFSDVANGKPHPEPFLKSGRKFGFDAHDCIVLEDAPAGIRAGKASALRVIAFRTPFLRGTRLAGAD